MTRRCTGSLISVGPEILKIFLKTHNIKCLDKVAILHHCGSPASRGFTQTYKHAYQLTIVPTFKDLFL